MTAPASLTYAEAAQFVIDASEGLDRWSSQPSLASSVSGDAGAPAGARDSQPTVRRLAVDLTPLNRFDSSAIAAMVALERRAAERNVELRFLNATPNLRKLATLYAVDSLLFGN